MHLAAATASTPAAPAAHGPVTRVHIGSPRFVTAEYGGFVVTDAAFPARLVLAVHQHDRPIVVATLRGEWEAGCGGRTLVNGPGLVVTLAAGESHSERYGANGAHLLVVEPDARRAAELGRASTIFCGVRAIRSQPVSALAWRLHSEVIRRDGLSPLAIEALSLEIVTAAAREEARLDARRPPEWLRETVATIEARCTDPLSVEALAARAGVHPAHLVREFQRYFRCGIATYARQLRVEHAAERLAGSDDEIAAIATDTGFVDPSHLTRWFRRQIGVPPAEFRRRERRRHGAQHS